jgi:hypothetical protein
MMATVLSVTVRPGRAARRCDRDSDSKYESRIPGPGTRTVARNLNLKHDSAGAEPDDVGMIIIVSTRRDSELS